MRQLHSRGEKSTDPLSYPSRHEFLSCPLNESAYHNHLLSPRDSSQVRDVMTRILL